MRRWSEEIETGKPNITSSRTHLVWNWNEYVSPSRLSVEASTEMVERLHRGFSDLGELGDRIYVYAGLDEPSELNLRALKERRILNSFILAKKPPMGLLSPEKEDVSLVLNGTDHIRPQVLLTDMHLNECYQTAERINDYINARFPYAFDDKYGYLTLFPTNVETGLQASVIIHLSSPSLGKKFESLLSGMSRSSVSMKGVYGEGRESYSALYEISSQTAMRRTEKELIGLVTRAAGQLNDQGNQVRQMALEGHRLEREDEVYKSYGVLKYARRSSMKKAQISLFQLMTSVADGILELSEPCLVYRLTLGIQTASLQKLSDRPLDKEEPDMVRVAYPRKELSEVKD